MIFIWYKKFNRILCLYCRLEFWWPLSKNFLLTSVGSIVVHCVFPSETAYLIIDRMTNVKCSLFSGKTMCMLSLSHANLTLNHIFWSPMSITYHERTHFPSSPKTQVLTKQSRHLCTVAVVTQFNCGWCNWGNWTVIMM